MEFLGHSVAYWLELDRRFKRGFGSPDLLEEVVKLQGKVAFYESRVNEMAAVASRK